MTDRQENGAVSDDTEQGWFDRAPNIKKLMWALYVACAASIVLEIAMRAGHIGHFEKMTGLYAIAGFFGGVVLVFAARNILERMVHRSGDYYDD